MASDIDKTNYYANRSKYRFIKLEGDLFTVYVFGHDKKQFKSLREAELHRDILLSL